MDQTPCAANHREPCTRRDEHLVTCAGDCGGCLPRPAVHGYLCRRYYEQLERAGAAYDRLRALARTLGVDSRAVQATSSASTRPGARVPLSSLQLDLDELDRMCTGNVETEQGAVQALRWSKQVFAATANHPQDPPLTRLSRFRCQACRQLVVIVTPPEHDGDDQILECKACAWTSRDADTAEAAAHLEIRVDAATRRWLRLTARERLDGDDRRGIVAVVDALR